VLSKDTLQPLLQQMFKMASHSTNTSLEMSSPFASCLLYATPDRTQTLLQLVFQKFQKLFKVIFSYHFVANKPPGMQPTILGASPKCNKLGRFKVVTGRASDVKMVGWRRWGQRYFMQMRWRPAGLSVRLPIFPSHHYSRIWLDSGFQWSKRWRVAVASSGPWSNHLHLAPVR